MNHHTRRTTPRRALLGATVAVSLLALGVPLSTAAPVPATASPPKAATGVVGEWTQYQGGATHTGAATDTTLDRTALTRLAPVWNRHLASASAPVVSDGLVYVVERQGVTALAVADGTLSWHTHLPTVATRQTAPAVGGGVVVVIGPLSRPTPGRKGAVWGLDSATGAILWTHYLPDVPDHAATISAQAVYVTAADKLSKLWLRSGRLAWTSAAVASSPASVDGDTVLVSNQAFRNDKPLSVTSVDAVTGAVRWNRTLSPGGGCDSWSNGTVLVAGHVAYAGDCYGSLRAVGTSGGRSVWTTNIRVPNHFPMAASNELLYAIDTYSHGLLAVDRLTGAVRWTAKADPSYYQPSPVVVGDTLLLAGGQLDGAVIDLLDTSTGAPVGTTDLRALGLFASFPAVAEGRVFVMVDFQLVALAPPA